MKRRGLGVGFDPPSSSGSLAMLAAIRRASFVSSCSANANNARAGFLRGCVVQAHSLKAADQGLARLGTEFGAESSRVAFLALTLNTRRDDYEPPADERRAQGDEEEKEKLACRVHQREGRFRQGRFVV
jgi:hypothetical protein